MIDGSTKLYGIIGNPVRHSLSPVMHNAAFQELGMNGVYVPMQTEDGKGAVTALKLLGFQGASVTIPHKEAVMDALDEVDPVAQKIGAVNTLLFRKDPDSQHIISRGFNTDWLGSNLALSKYLALEQSKFLILGAGGAAKAVAFGLVEAGAEVFITNRTAEKGENLAAWLGCKFLEISQVDTVRVDAFINTSSVGMEPNAHLSPIDASLLSDFSVVMDIVYAPLKTRLLKEATAAGCKTIDGLAMLLYQGAAQFKIWTGKQPSLPVMRAAMEKALKKRSDLK